MPKDEFIKRATKAHNGLYSYNKEKITYVNNHIKIPIICPIHGEFWQTPANHLLGIGCPFCQTSKLEKEQLSLDDSVKLFEEGMKISKECNSKLENAEKKITMLINEADGIKEENFEAED
jgi:exodeoxyribonuclease VII small subunit